MQKAGGEKLAKAVYEDKLKDGSTVLTHIHHRQTPLFLIQGVADAGVTWQSGSHFFRSRTVIRSLTLKFPTEQNTVAIYAGAEVADAAHPDAAKAWLDFIKSPAALGIFGNATDLGADEAAGK